MKARGLAWLGTRTRNFDETVRFFGDTLGSKSRPGVRGRRRLVPLQRTRRNVYEITTPAKQG
jgi:hypothetical protein